MSSSSSFKRNLPGRLDRNRVEKSAKLSHGSSARSIATAVGSSPLPPLPPKGASSKDPKGSSSSPQPRSSGESMPASRANTRSSKGNDPSPELGGGERSKLSSHINDFVSFLSKDVLPAEDRWLAGLSDSSLPAEASHQAALASFTVFRLQEQVVRQKEKAVSASAGLKEVQRELEEAKKCLADFELLMTKKELEIKQRENDFKLKETELKLGEAELKKKDQLMTASAARLKEHAKELEGLRAELEEVKKSLQLKEDEISKLFDEADRQFDAGADSAFEMIKSRFPDLDYSLLDQPLDQASASIASGSEVSAPGSPAPPLELASSLPSSSSPLVASSMPSLSLPHAASSVPGSSSPPTVP